MKLSELLELLKEHDKDCEVFIGKLEDLGGGKGGVIDNNNLFVSKVSNSLILHTNNPKKPLDHGDGRFLITDFD